MLKKIIEISVKHRLLVLLFTVFITGWGIWTIYKTPIDAIPDLSDVQVIIFTEYPGQAPQVVEDQVTYPLTTAMLAVPKAKVVRGYSFFGVSFVYIIFEDGTDIYWARSRVLEYLNFAANKLPSGVSPSLGPDATGVGWVYEYALEGKGYSLAELRSIQDWFVRYQLTSVPGVSEVASIGGFVKQYQVNIDPNRLVTHDVTIDDVVKALRMGNRDTGGRVLEMAEREYMVRGLGYIKSIPDIENIVLKVDRTGTPVRIRDVARVEIGPDERRGLAELDGEGEAVGGIVVMRFGENALTVINGVKAKLDEIKAGLPPGVSVRPVYDRSELIYRAIETLKEKLIEESILVSIVCIIFLLHFRSSLVAIIMLPIGILVSFIVMYSMGINANIMSLGGIAIAIGAMIDGAIIMVENCHKHLERESGNGSNKPHWDIVTQAAKEVGPALFFSLLIITVSFMPIFTLEAQEGRLFKPLAYTKTFAMAAAAILSITLVPVLMGIFIRGKIRPEEHNPITRSLIWVYRPAIEKVLKYRKATIFAAIGALALTAFPIARIGSEFMPALNEGTLLYMPVTLPGVSVTKAAEILQTQDKIIKSFPEVESVFGKAGRALTATDPAPFEMFETVINLKPMDEWRPGMTTDKLIEEMDSALDLPGITNAWTMPIKARIDMLSTGIRTPVGIKVFGKDLNELEKVALDVESAVKKVPGTSSAYAERIVGGYYLDIDIKREEAARYGLRIEDIQDVVMSAIGGENVTTTVEGLERYPVNVRYKRELRDNVDKLGRVLVPTMSGDHIPLYQVADLKIKMGPPGIRTEDALLTTWIFVDVRGRDIGGYVKEAKAAVADNVKFPPGYYVSWSGQYEYMQRAYSKLKVIIPLTLLIIFLLLYFNFKSLTECLIILLAIPFSLIGAAWLIYLLGYNLSIGVAVGFIALAGLDAEMGIVMLIYLNQAYNQRKEAGRMNNWADLHEAIIDGTVLRVRPKLMTVTAIIAGLLPIMWSTGTGADVMKKIAAPMVGGMFTSGLLELLVLPAIYAVWKGRNLPR
ncbi:MAG TPA: CusA/CzcA family heavy metal efflux RND transporter [Deltaproteobacteria bacterium]|nr:MAG: cation transporter [Deltaproteobacteria bacterium GWA2_55_82]OGQ63750.1 MAG: cation transporter [Deltaproteobacteria bacterium RIFCSPLOWO2_02_FULL_55_12]OIJ73473.1 MAG: cation transporter [Deltaproteobacteria bacterium GWC2_55_46]HBG47339.1 CusA/CzcA family heavy metal efflux RND transporter [Deltaproteobacteria bacterium]HCY10105.1 CusA/CzcA family heavy metal efflux RND transporter [Deltaproteobacteria bacterium]